jgi:transcriptional regulator with XRE-family HTH domain
MKKSIENIDPATKVAIAKKLYAFGRQIREARKKVGLTQKEYGERMGLCRNSAALVSNIESGRRSPTFAAMVSYARILGFDIEINFKLLEKGNIRNTKTLSVGRIDTENKLPDDADLGLELEKEMTPVNTPITTVATVENVVEVRKEQEPPAETQIPPAPENGLEDNIAPPVNGVEVGKDMEIIPRNE